MGKVVVEVTFAFVPQTGLAQFPDGQEGIHRVKRSLHRARFLKRRFSNATGMKQVPRLIVALLARIFRACSSGSLRSNSEFAQPPLSIAPKRLAGAANRRHGA